MGTLALIKKRLDVEPNTRSKFTDGDFELELGERISRDMGYPQRITITIEPGDRLNQLV